MNGPRLATKATHGDVAPAVEAGRRKTLATVGGVIEELAGDVADRVSNVPSAEVEARPPEP